MLDCILHSAQIPGVNLSSKSKYYSKVEHILCSTDNPRSLYSGMMKYIKFNSSCWYFQGISVVLKESLGSVNLETALFLRISLFFFVFMICVIANVISVLRLLVVIQVNYWLNKKGSFYIKPFIVWKSSQHRSRNTLPKNRPTLKSHYWNLHRKHRSRNNDRQ